MDPLEAISKIGKKISPGRSASFIGAHIIKTLEEIDNNGSVGRLKLSKDLHLGEGETRTLVKHLKNERLIDISRTGISLSPSGKELLISLRTLMSEPIELTSTFLTVGRFNIAVRIVGMENYVRYGVEQRDIAMMGGAEGATTLVFTKNRLTMPGTEEDVAKHDPSILAFLSKVSLKEGDVVIIGTAHEKTKAELGARTAALELLKLKP